MRISNYLFLLLLFSTQVWGASENLGQFRFSEFSIAPELKIQEPGIGGFQIQKTYLGFEWMRDESLRGQIWLGSSDLLQSAVWFTPVTRPDLGISEAYLEGKSSYGEMRAGLLNVLQGYEGVSPEWALVLPASQSARQGWLMKRDYGLQFRWTTKPFFTAMTVHNGETGANSDGKFWYSGAWQYKNSNNAGVLLTASVGNTKPESTSGSLAQSQFQFNFDPSGTAKIRYATLTFFKDDERSLFLIEGGRGDIIQNDIKRPYAWGRADFSFNLGGDLNMLLRYEQTQSNLKETPTIKKSSSGGFSIWSKDRLQSVTLYGIHHEEDPKVMNDEYFLIFRLNSRYLH